MKEKCLRNKGIRAFLMFVTLLWLTGASAQVNYGMYFPGGDGANSNVDISGLNLTSLPFTVEMWIKPEGTQVAYAGLFYHRGTSNAGIYYAADWEGANMLRLDFGGDKVVTSVISTDEWHHVAVVVSSGSKTIYVDGDALASNTKANSSYDFSGGELYLGFDKAISNRTFKGMMDEVRIWNSERTLQDLEDNKYVVLNGDEEKLVAYYNFDDQNTDHVTDVTTNGLNGTINGASYAESDLYVTMQYKSSAASQEAGFVNSGSSDNVIMSLEVETENLLNPLSLSKLYLSTGETTTVSSIENVKIYYTGSDAVFGTETLVTETGSTPGSEFMVNTDFELEGGKNYFWIIYDISSEAVKGDVIDVTCDSLTITGAGEAVYVPVNPNPAAVLEVNPDIFIQYEKHPIDVITTNGFTTSNSANFVSFQQNAIMTYKGYQFVTYWNKAKKVCLARKALPDGDWEEIVFTDYISPHNLGDNHYNISFGICEKDGSFHIAFDHHNDALKYRISRPGLANDGPSANWTETSFGVIKDYLVNGQPLTAATFYGAVTYPRFISEPNGKLLFECRTGISGDGNSHLWEYNGSWSYIGEYLHGRSDGMPAAYTNKCGYINGLHYTPGGTRLHVSMVWRETPNASSNHDVSYAYSDDDGRTWFNAEGTKIATSGSDPLNFNKAGFKVYDIGENRGLINQEAQAVDSKGGIHILQSYMLDNQANNSSWPASRQPAWLRHIYQDESGEWQSDEIASIDVDRSDIAVDANDNLYVVTHDYRVYFATAADKWKTWTEMDISEAGSATAEVLIDRELLLADNILSFVFAHSSLDGRLMVPYYKLGTSTAFEKNKSESGLSMRCYPNPTQSCINLDVKGAFTYQVLDIYSRLMMSGEAYDHQLIGLALDQGLYYVTVSQKGASNTRLVIKH